ncbi:hypothetical protein PQX77_012049 [Marasmius sp. AFHP31]|nr:hypothetical protein PQX77_012049 [Marasmius sp. AFHP31]
MVQRTGRDLYGDVATSRNFEMLSIDGAADPYQDLVLAATIGAGASGVEGRRELGGGGCKGSRCGGEMTEERKELEEDKVMKGVLGKDMVEAYLTINKVLEDVLTNQDETEEQKRLRQVELF